jgi:hypothetical protein
VAPGCKPSPGRCDGGRHVFPARRAAKSQPQHCRVTGKGVVAGIGYGQQCREPMAVTGFDAPIRKGAGPDIHRSWLTRMVRSSDESSRSQTSPSQRDRHGGVEMFVLDDMALEFSDRTSTLGLMECNAGLVAYQQYPLTPRA